jgi:glutamyl-tRNA synthetase
MDPDEWRDLKSRSIPCVERDGPINEQMEKWDNMLEGAFDEGEASLVIKTDIAHKNPAVRDFVGMRIKHTPHPRTGDRYHLYPLYNLSVAIDDHLMECTHILRGKDHLNNTLRQEFVYSHMGWTAPNFTHYGLVSIPDTLLKTSLIREEIDKGRFSGWDDIRLGTVRALAARGFLPNAIRNYWLEVGVKSVDITFSWETLKSMNRELIDRECPRYYFVKDPIELDILTEIPLAGRSLIHPERPELGSRNYNLVPEKGIVKVFVQSNDMMELSTGDLVRLKDLCNLEMKNDNGTLARISDMDLSSLREKGAPIIHWVSEGSIECQVRYSDGTIHKGLAEPDTITAAKKESVVQFERFGYCKLRKNNIIYGNFTHL